MKYLIALLLPLAAWAAVWPDEFGAAKKVSAQPVTVSDRKLWDEYGFQGAEAARYEGGGLQFTATAYRLLDSTGAMAAFEWQRPADAQPGKLGKLSARTKDGLMMAYGNYLLVVTGYHPPAPEMTGVAEKLSNVEKAPLPTLPDYLPSGNLVPNSERYVLGPEALARFAPGIPPSVAAFRLGAEAQLGAFTGPGGEMRLVIFNYPTPQIAIQQYEAFVKLPGVVAKRTGPLVALALAPPNADAAEHLLAQVRYQGAITISERVPTQRDNIGDLIVNAFELIGILLVFALVSGLAFGGARALRRRGKGADRDAMIVLDLRER